MQRLDSMKFLLLGLCLHIKKLAQLNGWLTFFNYNKQCILIIRVSNVTYFSNNVYKVCKRMLAIQMCNTLCRGCLKMKFLSGPQIILIQFAVQVYNTPLNEQTCNKYFEQNIFARVVFSPKNG